MIDRPREQEAGKLERAHNALERLASLFRNTGVIVGSVIIVTSTIAWAIWDLASDSITHTARLGVLHLLAGPGNSSYLGTLSKEALERENFVRLLLESKDIAKLNEERVDSVFMSRIYRYFSVSYTQLLSALESPDANEKLFADPIMNSTIHIFANKSQSYRVYLTKNDRDRSFDERPLYFDARTYELAVGSPNNTIEINQPVLINRDISCLVYESLGDKKELDYDMIPMWIQFDDASQATEYSFDVIVIAYKTKSESNEC